MIVQFSIFSNWNELEGEIRIVTYLMYVIY